MKKTPSSQSSNQKRPPSANSSTLSNKVLSISLTLLQNPAQSNSSSQ